MYVEPAAFKQGDKVVIKTTGEEVEVHGFIRFWQHGDHKDRTDIYYLKAARGYLTTWFRERDLKKGS